jgi:antitoxin (DNA-binding transcriptional repressor) of toxin-antitoxin stability system
MKTATIRQVRNDLGTVLAWVAAGEEVTVLNRKTPVARICPPRAEAPAPVKMPDFAARAKATFGRRKTHLADGVMEEREKSRW